MPTQQISGTIYQMYDASGNNRRFPVTVVDGVLGLASYLREQFSSLASLYMGINDVALSGTVLTVKGVSVNLATVTDLSNYYTKTEADGRFLGINANAFSATKLHTARTIWGQSFDGTANVTGAMSGVTNIDSLINIDNGYVGIGKTPSVALDVNGQISGTQLISTVTSSAPLVVSSSALVSNLNADKLDNYDLADILAMDITGNAKTATNPKSELKTGQEFVFRKTNVEWDAKSGVIKKIVGKSLAWNQLAQIKSQTLITSIQYGSQGQDIPLIDGHKYYISAVFSGVSNLIGFGLGHPGFFSEQGVYKDFSSNGRQSFVGTFEEVSGSTGVHQLLFMLMNSGATVEVTADDLMCVDLTLLFNGSVPSNYTVADFERDYPELYYPYCAGELSSNDAEAVETTGVNQWDEETLPGYYNASGVYSSESNQLCTKNYIPVIAGQTYYYGINATLQTSGNICYYDANKNFIRRDDSTATFTVPSGASYIKASFGAYYGTTYNHDICINLSNSAINGQYFPFWKRTINIGITTRKDTDGNVPFADGMKGAGTAADWCDKVGGEVVMGEVDLGSLNWTKLTYIGFTYFAAQETDKIHSDDNNDVVVCKLYPYSLVFEDKSVNTIQVNFNEQINIVDSAFNSYTADQFKAAMAGVKLVYEKATPVPFTWAEPFPSVYPCDQFGTERVISPVSVTPSAPFCADIQYGAKSDDIANDLIGTRDAVQPLLDALQYDGQNHAWHLKGNLYADGFITAYGINGGAQAAVIAPYLIESSNCDGNKIYVGLNVLNEAIAKYKQGYLVQAKKAGEYITYSVTSIDESSYILYCNGGSVTVELES